MFRARWAALILAAGLGLVCGCLCRFPFCSRNNGEEYPTAGCCEVGGAPVGELPCVEGGAPAFPAVPPGYVVPPGPPTSTNGMPRLAPVPQAPAPVYPSPQSRLKDSRPGELELVH